MMGYVRLMFGTVLSTLGTLAYIAGLIGAVCNFCTYCGSAPDRLMCTQGKSLAWMCLSIAGFACWVYSPPSVRSPCGRS